MGNFFECKPIRLLAKFVDVIMVNVVFLISCIPIFTIGAALTALYYTCVKSIRMDCGNLLKEYKNSFQMNFKTATAAWLFLAVALSAVGYAAYRMLAYQGGQAYVVLIGLCMALLLFLIAVTVYTFPVLSRFTVSWKGLLRSAIIMSVKHGGETIYMLVLTLGLGTMVVVGWKFFPVILIVMPGIYVLLLSVIMEKVLAIYIMKQFESQQETSEVVAEQTASRKDLAKDMIGEETDSQEEPTEDNEEVEGQSVKEESDSQDELTEDNEEVEGQSVKKESDSQDESAGDTDDSPIFREEGKRMPWYLEGGNRDE